MAASPRRNRAKAKDVPRVSFETLCKTAPTEEELVALRWAVTTLWDELALIQNEDCDRHKRNARIVSALDRWGMLPKRLTPKLRDGAYYVMLTGRGLEPLDALLWIAERVNSRGAKEPHEHAALERVHVNIRRYRSLLAKRDEHVPALDTLPTVPAAKSYLEARSRTQAPR